MKIRFFKYLATLLIISLCFSACTTKSSSSDEASTTVDKKTITLLHYFSGSLSGGIDDLVDDFNNGQENYFLNSIPIDHEAYKISILNSLEEGNPPEIYSYWAGARTKSIKEYLLPLDSIWEEYEFNKIFPESIIKSACKVDGHYYLLPITQHYVTFFYNKKVFESQGLVPPKTWEEFINICETLKSNNITPIGLGAKNKWPAQFWFDYLLLRTAGYEYRESLMNGFAHYTDPEVKLVFSIWNDLIDEEYFNENILTNDWYEAPLEGLKSNTIGMTLMGTWAVSVLNNDFDLLQGEDFGYFNFPIINPDVEVTALGPIDGLIIPKDSVNTEGALEALRYLSNEKSQTSMALGSGAFSPSLKVDDTIYSDFQIEMLEEIKKQNQWAFNYDLSTPPEVADLGLSLFIEFYQFPDKIDILLQELDDNVSDILKK